MTIRKQIQSFIKTKQEKIPVIILSWLHSKPEIPEIQQLIWNNMKTSEKIIIETAEKVMEDIGWPYDKSEQLIAVFTSIEDQFKRFQNLKGFEENKHKIYAYWTVSLEFPKEERWEGRNTYFILVKDEDGEPYDVRHRQAKFKLIKDEDGKYKLEKY